MKKICGTITILILAAALIALAACSNILDSPQSKQGAETGTVYIAIDGDSAGDRVAPRTLAPDQANFARYTASFEGPGTQAEVNITVGNSTPISLAPGEWTITVTAYTGANAATGRGSATVTVVSNQTAAADITITPIIGGSGNFRYSVAIPAVDSATLSLTNMTTNITVTSINLKNMAGSSGGTAAALRYLTAGYYRMNILLEKNGTYAGGTEVVHIYNGLETTANYVFTDADFAAVVGSLTDGVWQDGEIATGSGSEYYKFSVAAGETYAVYWNDSYSGDGTKDLDIRVSAYYETGGAPIFSDVNSGYTNLPAFIAASSGNVIVRVAPINTGHTGTYSVKYGTLPVIDLTDGIWHNAEMTVSGYEYYRFHVMEGVSYAVSWNGDGTNPLSGFYVRAYYETGENFFGLSGYEYTHVLTAASSGNVIIRVEPYYSGDTGTYAVMYGEVRPLAAGTAETGTITAGGVKLYSFPAAANTVYEISWEDSVEHAWNSYYNGDITVTAYLGNIGPSYPVFNAVDSGYTTPRTVNYPDSITIYLKVNGVSDGTYSIKAQEPVQHTVTFNADGGSPVTQTRMVSGGGTVGSANMPSVPTKDDYDFGGWHTGQNGGGTEFTDSTTVTESITVYAKWTPSVPIQITLQLGPADPQLTGEDVPVNQPATFNVEAGYSDYTWYWDGFVIGGAASSSYTLPANSKPTGIYELSVVVTDNSGERLSARCQVTIKAQ